MSAGEHRTTIGTGHEVKPPTVDDHGAPLVWPGCSTCEVAFVLRRCYSLTNGMTWLWQRDCTHRAPTQLFNADGPYVPPADPAPATAGVVATQRGTDDNHR